MGFNEDRDGVVLEQEELLILQMILIKIRDIWTGPRNGGEGAVAKFKIIDGGLQFGILNDITNEYEIDSNIIYETDTTTR